jgi:hypothetical protein
LASIRGRSIESPDLRGSDIAAGLELPWTHSDAVATPVVDTVFPGAPASRQPSSWSRGGSDHGIFGSSELSFRR